VKSVTRRNPATTYLYPERDEASRPRLFDQSQPLAHVRVRLCSTSLLKSVVADCEFYRSVFVLGMSGQSNSRISRDNLVPT